MKNLLTTIAGISLFVVVAVALLTFVRNVNRQPSTILSSTECMPPCWKGIHPGETKPSQVYEVLDHMTDVDRDTIMWENDRNEKLIGIYWFFQRPMEDAGGYIYFKDQKVSAIKIDTISSLTLGELFEKLGEPEQMWTTPGRGENREYLEVNLINRSKGYVASALIDYEGNTSQVEIQAKTLVFHVLYFAPEMFDELLDARILIEHPVDPAAFEAWKGFGAIPLPRK